MKPVPGPEERWKSHLPFLAVTVFLCTAAGYLSRPLWFDEVITMDWLAAPLWKIPFLYSIPNNHIIYTMYLKLASLLQALHGMADLRLLRAASLIPGILLLLLLTRRALRSGGVFAAALPVLLAASSGAFRLYGTAIRGYMTGTLFVFCAFLMAERYVKRRRKGDLLLYFLFCCLAVGTIPTNVLAIGSGLLFLLPALFRKRWKEILFLGAGAFLSVWVSYLHILGKLLRNSRLEEGWDTLIHTCQNIYVSLLVFFLPVVFFALAGMVKLFLRHPELRLRVLCFAGILLVPPLSGMIFRVPPFPRVYFPLLPLWTLILVIGLRHFSAGKTKKVKGTLLVLTVLWLVFTQYFPEKQAAFLFGSVKRDDFFCTYPMVPGFVPHKVAGILKSVWDGGELQNGVFVEFDADPPSIQYASLIRELPGEMILSDLPCAGSPVKPLFLPEGVWIIADSAEKMEAVRQRFRLSGKYRELILPFPSLQRVFIPE